MSPQPQIAAIPAIQMSIVGTGRDLSLQVHFNIRDAHRLDRRWVCPGTDVSARLASDMKNRENTRVLPCATLIFSPVNLPCAVFSYRIRQPMRAAPTTMQAVPMMMAGVMRSTLLSRK